MALLPSTGSSKRRLFVAPKPNYQDFSGPPNGDYVRYVEGLMAWAQQEQEHLRLQALGAKSQGTLDTTWGRHQSAQPDSSRVAQPASLSTSSVTRLRPQWLRQVQAYVQNLQQQAAQMPATAGVAANTAETVTPAPPAPDAQSPAKGRSVFMWLLGVVLLAISLLDFFEF